MIETSRNKNNRMAHSSEAAEVGLDAVWWPAPQPEHAAQLARFESIDLEQMAGAALLDRVETKYVFHEQNLDAILGALLDSYRILEVNGNRLNHYRTLYYDTPDFGLYHRHHAGGRNRYKVRGRSYLDSDTSFLEIKRKVKENRTIKSRVRTTGLAEQLTPPMNGFLQAHLPPGSLHLEPKLWNEYTRVTLVGLGEPERVTLDLNLRVRAGDRTIIWPGVVVAEVKAGGHDHDSVFKQLMKARGTRFTSFSKYCIGVSMLYPEIKHNRFKPKLRMISQLIQKEGNYVN